MATQHIISWRSVRFALACLLLASAASACVSLPQDFKQPQVALMSIAPRLGSGITPEFDLVLRVTNPNRRALSVRGLSYTIDVAGRRLVDGVANDIPKIAAYGEADVNLSARADLLGGLGLLTDLLARPGERIEYEFNAELDLGALYPTVRVQRSGAIRLGRPAAGEV